MKRPKFEGNRKEQVAQAKERRVALLQRAKQKQAQPSVDHAPPKLKRPRSLTNRSSTWSGKSQV
ncbi:hypothetical protein IV41_GL001807 [Limosilactobacillus ingluviei]|uniref:Uncharacterized protein n=1 Tax=Limosilactobacillus ingluviei TaxID=148604 RepID=A0A0R2H5S3_9LACO|nr:hypothetical protein IV41_GL001807 [Limosilactobacillus ingluviei]